MDCHIYTASLSELNPDAPLLKKVQFAIQCNEITMTVFDMTRTRHETGDVVGEKGDVKGAM